MSPDRKPAQNRSTKLSKELAQHVRQRAEEEDQRINPNGEYQTGGVFDREGGLTPKKAVEMRWTLDYLRQTGRLRNAPRRR